MMLSSAENGSTSNILERDIMLKPDFLRPDALLGSAWLSESSQMARERTDMKAIEMLLGDDCCNKHKPTETSLTCNGAETSLTFSGAQGLDIYPWYNMPHACQMPEHP